MAVVTIYRLAEECLRVINAGDIQSASPVSFEEVKIAIGQVVNQLLKVDYFTNLKMNERIPNGTVLAWYENIEVQAYGANKCTAVLPITPIKLPRNMGCFAIYVKTDPQSVYELDKELIPIQMGQGALLKSQKGVSDLSGYVGYEPLNGTTILIHKNLKTLFPEITLAARLAVMDVSLLDDYDILPISADSEWSVKQEVIKFFLGEGIADKVVDPSNSEQQNNPIKTQSQA